MADTVNKMDKARDTKAIVMLVLGWLRRNIKPIAGLFLVIAITAGILYFYWRNPDIFDELKSYGYLGAFIISIILNATIILPVSNMAVLMALGAAMPSPVHGRTGRWFRSRLSGN